MPKLENFEINLKMWPELISDIEDSRNGSMVIGNMGIREVFFHMKNIFFLLRKENN